MKYFVYYFVSGVIKAGCSRPKLKSKNILLASNIFQDFEVTLNTPVLFCWTSELNGVWQC